MSSMIFNAQLDTSHHRLPHYLKETGIVADSLTGLHNATVKCSFIVNRSCKHKNIRVSPRGFESGVPVSLTMDPPLPIRWS
jgi:hypothetical protein